MIRVNPQKVPDTMSRKGQVVCLCFGGQCFNMVGHNSHYQFPKTNGPADLWVVWTKLRQIWAQLFVENLTR